MTRTKRNLPPRWRNFRTPIPRAHLPRQSAPTPYLTTPARIRGICWIWIARRIKTPDISRAKFLGTPAGNCRRRKSAYTKNILTRRRADLYRLDLDAENQLRIADAANRLASRKAAFRVARVARRRVHSFRLPAVGEWRRLQPVGFGPARTNPHRLKPVLQNPVNHLTRAAQNSLEHKTF